MNNLKLTIPEACHEDFSKMKAEEKGRWCGSCQKHVVDFTTRSNEEIIAYFSNHGGSGTCGIFHDRQLNRPLLQTPLPVPAKSRFSVRFIGLFMLFITNLIMSCRVQKPRLGGVVSQEETGGSGISPESHLLTIQSTCDPDKEKITMGPIVNHYKYKKKENDSTQVVSGPDLPAPQAIAYKITLQFKPGKASVSGADKKKLDKVSELLIKNPDAGLYIAGYADSTGSEHLNKKVSKERAEAVAKFFLEKKTSNSIYVTWFGKKDFVAENETESGRAKNRRVEISVKE